jgi:glutamyl-tRNA reductase
LLLVDIAVPRNIDPAASALPGVECADIDTLRAVVDANLALRRAALPLVQSILREEQEAFHTWHAGRTVTPVIKDLRARAQEIAAEEVAQALSRLAHTDTRTQQTVERLAHRLVNRLLHEPTTRLRSQAAEGNGHGYSQAVRELFALADDEPLPCQCGGADVVAADGHAHCTLRCIAPPPASRSGAPVGPPP